MDETGPISGTEDLRAWLQELHGTGRDGRAPWEFEAAVRTMAPRLQVGLAWQPVLSLARIGWQCYAGRHDVPLDEPTGFRGRSADDLPPLARREQPRLRTEPESPDELVAHGESLCEDLEQWLTGEGFAEPGNDLGRVLAAYVAAISLHQVVGLGGWLRPLDAHAFAMLAAERALRHLDAPPVGAGLETACFRWVQLVAYDDVPPEHMQEQGRRRAIRLDHEHSPAGAVARMVSEVTPTNGMTFDDVLSRTQEAALTPEEVTRIYTRMADREEPQRRARAAGFADTGRLDLSPAAFDREHYDDYASGHLIRWMVEHDVPVRPLRMMWASAYTLPVVLYLVRHPVTKDTTIDIGRAHLRALHLLRKRAGSVPLADELIFLAWLMDQSQKVIRLDALLSQRDIWLRRLADETSE